jgi:xanthine/uracil permease
MVPLVVGDAFDLSAAQVGALTQRLLFVIGLVSLVQLWRGHRLPISEGISYVWMGLFVTLAGMARAAGQDPQLLLPKLEGGLIASGLALIAVAGLGLAERLERLFTPTVVATYLMLLPIQFAGPFLRSMLGVGSTAGRLDLRVAAVSFMAIITTLLLSLAGRGSPRSLSSLLGLAVGIAAWLLAGLPLGAAPVGAAGSGFLFPWGSPVWDSGVLVTSVITGFLLLSNVVAALSATAQVTGEELSAGSFRRAAVVNGVGGVAAGLLGGVGLVPIASSAGFVGLTGLASRLPFLLSCLLLWGVAFFPPVVRAIALLPLPLAYAVTFAAFNEMFGLGVLQLRRPSLTRGNLVTVSLSVFVGTGLMFLPPVALAGFHPVVRNLLGNGLLTGALLSLLLEHLILRSLDTPL